MELLRVKQSSRKLPQVASLHIEPTHLLPICSSNETVLIVASTIARQPILDTGIAAVVCEDEYKDAETTGDGTEAPLVPHK